MSFIYGLTSSLELISGLGYLLKFWSQPCHPISLFRRDLVDTWLAFGNRLSLSLRGWIIRRCISINYRVIEIKTLGRGRSLCYHWRSDWETILFDMCDTFLLYISKLLEAWSTLSSWRTIFFIWGMIFWFFYDWRGRENFTFGSQRIQEFIRSWNSFRFYLLYLVRTHSARSLFNHLNPFFEP